MWEKKLLLWEVSDLLFMFMLQNNDFYTESDVIIVPLSVVVIAFLGLCGSYIM